MKMRALIVEDDPQVIDGIEDALFSIGHEHKWVTNQHDAQQALQEEHFDYVMLDLQIPARPGRGGAEIQFGVGLLDHIGQVLGQGRLPVIIMTGHWAVGMNMSNRLRAAGAVEFIAKPFPPDGRTLAVVIREVLAQRSAPVAASGIRLFEGGTLELFEDRAKLLGVEIISDQGTGQALQVMKELAKSNSGRSARLAADEIADAIGAERGIPTVTGCVHTLRRNIEKRLREELNVICQSEDVIASGKEGYYLVEWITVVWHDEPDQAPSPVQAIRPSFDSKLDGRREWALEQLRGGVRLTRKAIQDKFEVSEKTAKRVLSGLAGDGLIMFERAGRDGYYRLRTHANFDMG